MSDVISFVETLREIERTTSEGRRQPGFNDLVCAVISRRTHSKPDNLGGAGMQHRLFSLKSYLKSTKKKFTKALKHGNVIFEQRHGSSAALTEQKTNY